MARNFQVRVDIDIEIPKEIAAIVVEKEMEVAEAIKRYAEESTAFKDKTGKLRKSIKIKKMRDKTVSSVELYDLIVQAGGRAAPHAHLVEFGHGGPNPAPAHPFLRPAKEKALNDIIWASARIAA